MLIVVRQVEMNTWDMEVVNESPQQHNGVDCLFFVMMYADCITNDLRFNFSQADMAAIRMSVCISIMHINLWYSNQCRKKGMMETSNDIPGNDSFDGYEIMSPSSTCSSAENGNTSILSQLTKYLPW